MEWSAASILALVERQLQQQATEPNLPDGSVGQIGVDKFLNRRSFLSVHTKMSCLDQAIFFVEKPLRQASPVPQPGPATRLPCACTA